MKLSRRSMLAGSAAVVPASLAAATGVPLDAADLGIRPDLDADQSQAVADALLAARSHGRPLFLPGGHYRVSNLSLAGNVQIQGVAGETRIVYGGGGSLMKVVKGDYVRLSGLVFDGQGLALAGDAEALVEVHDVADVSIAECKFRNSTGSGVRFTGCGGTLAHCRVERSRSVGIHVLESLGMTLRDNDVRDSGDTGILVQRWQKGADRSVIRGNRVSNTAARSGGTGQNGNGINLVQANGVIVADNQVDNSYYSGIRVFSSDNSQITGNVLTRSGEVALYVEFAFQGAVVADNIIDDAAFGISFANLKDHGGRLSVCSGNLVRNIRTWIYSEKGRPEGTGYGIGAEADIAITGNVIENAANVGLALGWGPYLRDITATGNVIRGSKTGIRVSVVEGSGPALIANNLVTGASAGDIIGMRWSDVATGDLAIEGADKYPHLTLG